MSTYNFFEPFEQAPVRKSHKSLILILAFIFMCALLGGYHYYLYQNELQVKSEIAEIEAYINSSSVKSKLEIVEAKKKKVDEMNELLAVMRTMSMQIDSQTVVTADYLKMLDDQLDANIFLTNLTVEGNMITLQGYADSYEAVAQFMFNLKAAGGVYDIAAPMIIKDESGYQFRLDGMTKLEVYNENQ